MQLYTRILEESSLLRARDDPLLFVTRKLFFNTSKHTRTELHTVMSFEHSPPDERGRLVPDFNPPFATVGGTQNIPPTTDNAGGTLFSGLLTVSLALRSLWLS
jgi:hypothetical protein